MRCKKYKLKLKARCSLLGEIGRKKREMLKYFEARSTNSIIKEEVKVEVNEEVENASRGDENIHGMDHNILNTEAEQPSTFSAAGQSSPLEHKQYHYCLLCYDRTCNKFGSTNAENDFRAMFIMKKMLNVLNDKLEYYLQTFGSPTRWVSVCDRCEPLIERAVWLEKEITRLENHLKMCQREMVDVVKKSMDQKVLVEMFDMPHSLSVTNETRTFVCTEREPMLAKHEKMKENKKNMKKEALFNNASKRTEMVDVVKKSMGQKGLVEMFDMPHCLSVTNETRTFVFTEREPMLGKLEKMKENNKNMKKEALDNASKRTEMVRIAKNVLKLDMKDPLGDFDCLDGTQATSVTTVFNDEHVTVDNAIAEPNCRAVNTTNLSVTSVSASTHHTRPSKSNQLAEEALSSIDPRTYSCKLCPNLKEMRLHSFVTHILFHYRRSYRCSICNTHFSSIKELDHFPINEKRIKEDGEGVHLCSNETLMETKFTPTQIWSCEHCPEMFDFETERDAHEQVVHDNEKFSEGKHECTSCRKKFRNLRDWRLHRTIEHPEITVMSCYFCDESFTWRTSEGTDDLLNVTLLKAHVKEYHNNHAVTLHECDFCGSQFEFTPGLQNHIQKEHGLNQNRSYSCSICFVRVVSKSVLKSHYRLVHKAGNSAYMCDSCGYETSNHYLFDRHNFRVHKIHPDNRAVLMCTYDGCTFQCLIQRDWKQHLMKVHNAKRKHKCKFCSKGFLRSIHCRDHEQIHLNQITRPFQCEICGNSFAVKNYLYIHMRLSHQNRPFASTHKKKPYRKRVRPNANASTVDTVPDGAIAGDIESTNNEIPIESTEQLVKDTETENPTSGLVAFMT